jgi:hypothetical protein
MRRRALFLAAVAAFALWFTVADGAADPSAPAITSGPSGLVSTNSATFAFTDGDAVSYSCQLDGGAASDCSSGSIAYAPLSDGDHTFSVVATDAGGVASAPSTRKWTVDTTPPAAPSITSGPSGTVSATDATFTFTDVDAVASYSCQLDGAVTDCSSGTAKYSSLKDAVHTFSVTAIDAAGNPSLAAPRTWTVDTTPPAPPVVDNGPTDPSGSQSATFTFSDSEPVKFACRLDSSHFERCSPPQAYKGLSDGQHKFQVQATDAAGNTSASKPFTWTVDTAHPLATVTDKPPLLTNKTSASFSFSATPAPDHYECRLDGAAYARCVSPKLYTGLSDGSHTFAVRTVSAGGTPSAATEYSWTVDTVAPETAIASGPPASSGDATATFAFTSTEDGSAFFCSLDAAGFTPCTSATTYAGLGSGSHTFRVQAVDPAGNADTTPATYSWTIAGAAPASIDLTPPANVGRLRRSVGYKRLQLRWTKPADADFDHVGVYVSTSARTAPRKLVYSGTAQSYTDRRFKNGAYYRYLVVSYDHAKNASRGSTGAVPASALLQSPRNGGTLRRSPTFRWTPVRGASFYNVQLFYRGAKVLSAWPTKARQTLTRRWTYLGRRHTLRPGTYVWYVWPGFGPQAKSRYGQLLGQGAFRVR